MEKKLKREILQEINGQQEQLHRTTLRLEPNQVLYCLNCSTIIGRVVSLIGR